MGYLDGSVVPVWKKREESRPSKKVRLFLDFIEQMNGGKVVF